MTVPNVPTQKRIRWRMIFAICLASLGGLFLLGLVVATPLAAWILARAFKNHGWEFMLAWLREEHRFVGFVMLPVEWIATIGLLLWSFGLWKYRKTLTWAGFLLFLISGIVQSAVIVWEKR